jgi:hypothetical protein
MRAMNRSTLVNGLGLQPRAAVASSWFTLNSEESMGLTLSR